MFEGSIFNVCDKAAFLMFEVVSFLIFIPYDLGIIDISTLHMSKLRNGKAQ